ncbi:mandelate racemase/muconate lactonizing enzyme family protein [Rhizobium sp. XQZ8]|uniref:mandelate racemase/muconate lactonizing enzyme family protein n=1 Tax=Rhizobium populisoli TaxID=2859785 RepID=UPI001CA50C3A|nr:mandelate racemase/muconate lactonizing enzyme family protein [Rhizobium populisoli]MBW6425147.1 mandelate racemase/muconate lactonizing enzyme family protein [Rhizobium populisoli]
MRITKVDHWLIRMPFTEDILWGSGRRIGTTRLICRIETDAGIIGWGETISLIANVPAVFVDIVAPLAIGYPVADAERFHRHVLGAGFYHHKRAAVMAICAMEMAMWDALGKQACLPLSAMWGGRWRKDVEAAAYLFTNDPKSLSERLKRFLDIGYTTFKVKIGFDERSDIAVAETSRKVIGDHPLRLDVNGAWNPATAKRQLEKLKAFDPAYVEQPLELDDLSGHAALVAHSPVPIALDESAYTLSDVGNIVRAQAADVVLLDPHEAGGLWQTIKAAAICEAVGISVTLHSGAELALSQSAYIHLAASLPNMSIAIDTERAYLGGDISPNAPVLVGGRFQVPEGPGLGVDIDVEKLEKYRVSGIAGAYLDTERKDWFPVKPAY